MTMGITDYILSCAVVCVFTFLITLGVSKIWWDKKLRAARKDIQKLSKHFEVVCYNEPVTRYVSGTSKESVEHVVCLLDPKAIVECAFGSMHMLTVTSKLSNELIARLPYVHKVIAKENMIGAACLRT